MTIEPLIGGSPAPAPDPYRSMFPNSAGLFTEPAPAPAAEADPAKLVFPNSPGLWAKPEQPAPTPTTRPGTPMPTAELPPEAGVLPEAYANAVVPEGFTVDQAQLAPIARDLARVGVNREQFEHLLGVHAKLEGERTAAEDRAFAAADQRWKQEAEAALAAPGAREALSVVTKAMPADVRRLLETSGLGNHPALIGWLSQIGRRLGR